MKKINFSCIVLAGTLLFSFTACSERVEKEVSQPMQSEQSNIAVSDVSASSEQEPGIVFNSDEPDNTTEGGADNIGNASDNAEQGADIKGDATVKTEQNANDKTSNEPKSDVSHDAPVNSDKVAAPVISSGNNETLTFEMMTSPHKKKTIVESDIIKEIVNAFNSAEKSEYNGMPAPGTLFRIYSDNGDLFSYCNGYVSYDGKWWEINNGKAFVSKLLSFYEESNAEEVFITNSD
jgi:hypothetical protein